MSPADGPGDRAEITFRYSLGGTRSWGGSHCRIHMVSAVGMERRNLILVPSHGYLFSRNVTRAHPSTINFE